MRYPFPSVIDNSMRTSFARCPQLFNRSYVEHWKPKVSSIHLHAGKAFAAGCEVARKSFYVEGRSHEDSVALGWQRLIEEYGDYTSGSESDVKSLERMSGALVYYFDVFNMGSDFIVPYERNGKSFIEFSATVPIDVLHPETGEPILYYGRFDCVGQHKDTNLYVLDDKTTSRLGQTWLDGWDLDSQFTGYCWLSRQFELYVAGAIVRGISILKNGYGHAQSIQPRPKHIIDAWYKQLCRDVKRMIELWKEGYFDHSFGPGCKMYGGCAFKESCRSNDPQRWLEADFEQRKYTPWESLP